MTALAAGVGGFMTVAAPAQAEAYVAGTAPAAPAPTPAEVLAAAPQISLTAVTEDVARTPAVVIGEQPFEASRAQTASPAEGAAIEVVRATRAATVVGTPPLAPGERLTVPVSFYYCTVGSSVAAQGDGGGFCGAMRDGSVVYNGAAACDVAYLGQQFRIEGDPLDRIYRCADTGSAVHGQHRDIWFDSSDDGWAWQRSIGQAATIEVLP